MFDLGGKHSNLLIIPLSQGFEKDFLSASKDCSLPFDLDRSDLGGVVFFSSAFVEFREDLVEMQWFDHPNGGRNTVLKKIQRLDGLVINSRLLP